MFHNLKTQLEKTLRSEPEILLRLILIGISVLAIVLALFAPPELQIGSILWFLLP